MLCFFIFILNYYIFNSCFSITQKLKTYCLLTFEK